MMQAKQAVQKLFRHWAIISPKQRCKIMGKYREIVIDNDERQKAQDKARLFITIAIYLLTAGTLMEYVSIPTLLKIIGFMLTGQAFYYLWKSNKF